MKVAGDVLGQFAQEKGELGPPQQFVRIVLADGAGGEAEPLQGSLNAWMRNSQVSATNSVALAMDGLVSPA